MKQRAHERRNDQLRRLSITYDVFTQSDASVLLKMGNTTVLCSVSLQQGVPRFLKGKGTGWLSAEYAMLPAATAIRTQRASTQATSNGRTVEISRFIGRVLRTVVDLDALGERTIVVDCDILCADGGTRTASIIAASAALYRAQERWRSRSMIKHNVLKERVVALSVGAMQDSLILDPDYKEDGSLDADFNFVMTESGAMIEVQGGAEKKALSWDVFDAARALAQKGSADVFAFLLKNEAGHDKNEEYAKRDHKVPLFSLQNRLMQKS